MMVLKELSHTGADKRDMSDNAVWDPGLDLTPEKDIPT
jgi:hypothetical protein